MKLVTNCFKIDIDFEEFNIQRLDYEDGLLSDLRERYNKSHSFFRFGKYIYISSGEENAVPLGNLVTLKVEHNPEIVSSLIRHIFFRSFISHYHDIKPTFNPITFPSRKVEHNLIRNFLPTELQDIISYKKLNEIHIKRAEANQKKIFFITIDSSYKWAVRLTCDKLIASGIDIVGLEVAWLVKYHTSSDVASPSFETLGKVISIEHGVATIDSNRGNIEASIDKLFLNKTSENIKLVLEHYLGIQKGEEVYKNVRQIQLQRNDPVILTRELFDIAKSIANIEYKNFDGFTFHINEDSFKDFSSFDLEEPQYLFDVSFTKSHASPSKGLDAFGPYDYGKFFEISHPKILVVCHRNSSGAFSQFLARLRDGMPETLTFPRGILAKYRLQNVTFITAELTSYETSEYVSSISKVLSENEGSFDLAIVETKEDFKKNGTTSDPYWVVKSYLLQRGITVQFIKEINARSPKFILDSCALQIYAKLGGTPWILPSSPNIVHEIIVGVGSTIVRNNIYAGSTQNRFVGITTFFNADGKYLWSNRSKEVLYQDYFEELLNNLKQSIERLSSEQAWQNNDIIRIIFHVFKPMKNLEVEVIGKLINDYSNYDIQFSFLSFGDHHPFLIFDLDQEGKVSNFSSISKGKFVPPRGTNFILDDGAYILQLKGPSDMVSDKQGVSRPLMIKIHSKSTFRDPNYLVQQVFRLTNISYKSFAKSQLPVTLLYASLITAQLNRLNQIDGWDPTFLIKLRNKKWFI